MHLLCMAVISLNENIMKQTDTSHYDVLNISPRASNEEVRQAYKTLAKVYHPDNNPNNKMMAQRRFQKISNAYSHILKQRKMTQRPRAKNDNETTGLWLIQLAERVIRARQGI